MGTGGRRRRSRQVQRGSIRGTLIAASAVGAIVVGAGLMMGGHEEPLSRDVYTSKEDCEADWGADQSICEKPVLAQGNDTHTSTRSTYGSSLAHSAIGAPIWYGPAYRSGARESALRESWAARTGGAMPVSGLVPGNRSVGTTSLAPGSRSISSTSSSNNVARSGFGSTSRSVSSSSSRSSSSS